MKTKLFYSFSLLLVLTIFLSSCKKEKLDDKKTTVLAVTENQNAIVNHKMLPTGGSSPLAYLGNGQWRGNWAGVVLTFQGPTDTQLMDGLMHWYTPISADNGIPFTSLGQIDGRSFTLNIAVISPTTSIQLPFITWFQKDTGAAVVSGDNVYPSSDYLQVISGYSGIISDLGSGTKITKCDIMIVQVDSHLELCSYKPSTSTGTPAI